MDLESANVLAQENALRMGDLTDALNSARAHKHALDAQLGDLTRSIENVTDQVGGIEEIIIYFLFNFCLRMFVQICVYQSTGEEDLKDKEEEEGVKITCET